MKKNCAVTNRRSIKPICGSLVAFGLMLLLVPRAVPQAQTVAEANPLQQKLMALKKSAAENKEKLRHYQWTETTQLTLKGEAKPEKVNQCSYGPTGQVQKVPVGAPQQQQAQQQQSGGRRGGALKQRIIEKKTEEMKDYMQDVQTLLALYLPPNHDLMQQAFEKKNASMDKSADGSGAQLVFRNYAKAGDQMTIAFDSTAHKISTINVATYMDDPKEAVTLAVRMASLPDGTNYTQQTVLNATAKQLKVTTTNSNYAKLQ